LQVKLQFAAAQGFTLAGQASSNMLTVDYHTKLHAFESLQTVYETAAAHCLLLCADWSVVQPLEFLSSFLKLVREPEVSGPITGVALTSLWRLLSGGILGKL
jgi:hypothetical protein